MKVITAIHDTGEVSLSNKTEKEIVKQLAHARTVGNSVVMDFIQYSTFATYDQRRQQINEKEIKNPVFSEIKNRNELFSYVDQFKTKLSLKERLLWYVLKKTPGQQDVFNIDQEINKIEQFFNTRIFPLSKILASVGFFGWLYFYKKYGKK